MTVGLIVVGDEILSGKRVDKHFAKVVELLTARGMELAWAEYVGDDPARITATLRRAFAGGDIVFSTGGIGATPDDHTRQCAAAALGRRSCSTPRRATSSSSGCATWPPRRACPTSRTARTTSTV
jgi:molybdenum cofactor synthesis domain-containing protein